MKRALAFAIAISKVLGVGDLSECVKEDTVRLVDISTNEYKTAYEMTLEPGNSCWFLTFEAAYAMWA